MAFTDLITTFRGLSIIGVVLSLLTVCGFVITGSLALDERFAGGEDTLEYQISKKQKALVELRERRQFFSEKLSGIDELESAALEYARIQVAVQGVKDANSAALSKLVSLRDGIRQTDEMFNDYKARYRQYIRGKAAGTKMDRLTTLDGETYEQVEVKAIGALGMTITHRDGGCRIPFKELPRDMQQLYQFDEEEAEAQLRKEADHRLQRQLALQSAQRVEEKKQIERGLEKQRKEDHEKAEAINNLTIAIAALDRRIIEAQNNLNLESQKGISRAPMIRQEIQQLQRAKSEYESKLRQLKMAR